MIALRLFKLGCMASPPVRRCPAKDSHARIPEVKKIMNAPPAAPPDGLLTGVNAYDLDSREVIGLSGGVTTAWWRGPPACQLGLAVRITRQRSGTVACGRTLLSYSEPRPCQIPVHRSGAFGCIGEELTGRVGVADGGLVADAEHGCEVEGVGAG